MTNGHKGPHRFIAMLAIGFVCLAIPRVGFAQRYFSFERYEELEQEMTAADESRSATEPGTDAYFDATAEALDVRYSMLRFLTQWLASGAMEEEYVSVAEEARLVLLQNVVRLNVDLGRCDDAREALREFGKGGRTDDTEILVALGAATLEVEACEAEQAALVEPVTDAPLATESSVNAIPIVFTIVGGAALITGLIWDGVNASTRSDFDDLRGSCDDPNALCWDEMVALRQDIQDIRVPIGTLVIGGGALAATGVLWLLLDRDADEGPPGSATVAFEPGYWGVSYTVEY